MMAQMDKEPDDPDFVDGAKHLMNDMDNTLPDGDIDVSNVEKDYQDLLDRMENGGQQQIHLQIGKETDRYHLSRPISSTLQWKVLPL